MKKLAIIISLVLPILALAQDSADVRFLELVNSHRAKYGLSPVKYSAALDSGCKLQADYMFAKEKVTHRQERDSSDGAAELYPDAGSRCEKFDPNFNRKFERVGLRENVAGGGHSKRATIDVRKFDKTTGGGLDRVYFLFQMWVNSPGHNAALLDPKVTHAAFAIRSDFKDNFRWHGEYACCILATAR